jgi:hypothetical protein
MDDVAIQYPDKTVQGRPDRVRLRLEEKYMLAAANRPIVKAAIVTSGPVSNAVQLTYHNSS